MASSIIVNVLFMTYITWTNLKTQVKSLRAALTLARGKLNGNPMRLVILWQAIAKYRVELYRTIDFILQVNQKSMMTRLFASVVPLLLPINVSALDLVVLNIHHPVTALNLIIMVLMQIFSNAGLGLSIARLSQTVHCTSRLFVPLQGQFMVRRMNRTKMVQTLTIKLRLMAMYEVVKSKRKITIQLANFITMEKRYLIKVGEGTPSLL